MLEVRIMEKSEKFPFRLEIGVWWNGKSHPIWCYDKVPAGMIQVRSLRELWEGRNFLSECLLGPDKGCYYTGIVRPAVIEALQERLKQGIPIYVSNGK